MSDLLGELRVAFRQWRRRPLVPLTIIVTLTAGMGAATAVFAVTWAVLWKPIDAPAPEQLVWIEAQSRNTTGQSSPGAYSEWQSTSRTFADLAAIRPVSGALADSYGTDRVRGALVTESLTSVFAIRPVAGRVFTAQEAQPGAPRTILISHRLWTNRYAADLSVVGRAVTMNGAPATIVGVLPASADGLVPEAEWWSPLALDARDRTNTGPRYLDVVGRLSTGTSIAAAREELAALSARLQLRDDDGSALGVAVTPFTHHLTARFASGLSRLERHAARQRKVPMASEASTPPRRTALRRLAVRPRGMRACTRRCWRAVADALIVDLEDFTPAERRAEARRLLARIVERCRAGRARRGAHRALEAEGAEDLAAAMAARPMSSRIR